MAKHEKASIAAADAPPIARDDRVQATLDRRRRLLDKDGAAEYLMVSVDTLQRLIHTGAVPIVKLPVERAANGRGQAGVSRRVLIDVVDLDRLIERSKETFR